MWKLKSFNLFFITDKLNVVYYLIKNQKKYSLGQVPNSSSGTKMGSNVNGIQP